MEQQVSGLFLKKLESCYDFHLEWQTANGEWIEVDERQLYPVTFAGRGRFDLLVSRATTARFKSQILFKIARHALQHGQAKNLIPEDVIRVRLVKTEWKAGQPELAHPQGAWKSPASLQVPANQRTTISEYLIANKTVVPVKVLSVQSAQTARVLPSVEKIVPAPGVPKPPEYSSLQRGVVPPFSSQEPEPPSLIETATTNETSRIDAVTDYGD